MPELKNKTKFWSMVSYEEADRAEITLYGDVISQKPRSFWTDEVLEGQYITPEDFAEDLARIRDKAEVVIKINSCGGDLYTGIAIHNALKGLSGHKTVIVEGIAASAASVIACASEMDAREAIRKLVHLYFAFLRENETYVRMVMWENLNRAQYFDEQGLAQVRNPIRRALKQILANGQALGEFREGVEEPQVLMSLFACTYNYFSNLYTMNRVLGAQLNSPEEMEKRAESISQMLLAYLKKE